MITNIKIEGGGVNDLINTLLIIPDVLNKALTKAGNNISKDVVKRVQKKGQATEGATLTTKSSKKKGRYSERYATKTREAKGLQVSRVDLTVTGDLTKDYKVIEDSATKTVVGFATEHEADKAEWLEAYYGEPIFDASQTEIDKQVDLVIKTVQDKLI